MSICISFDSLSPLIVPPPIAEQLKDQCLKLDMDPLGEYSLQRDADEVTRLYARGILTKAESGKARARILQIIKKQAKPL